MSSAESAPYDELVALIESELALARDARYEELARCAATRAEFVKRLPATPPAAARESLQRALALQQQLSDEAQRGRQALLAAASELERAGRAARGYAPPRPPENLSANA
jgi:hypothetical protein